MYKAFLVLRLAVVNPRGVTAALVSKELKVCRKTAERWLLEFEDVFPCYTEKVESDWGPTKRLHLIREFKNGLEKHKIFQTKRI